MLMFPKGYAVLFMLNKSAAACCRFLISKKTVFLFLLTFFLFKLPVYSGPGCPTCPPQAELRGRGAISKQKPLSNQELFLGIKENDTMSQVKAVLGQPARKVNYQNSDLWYYQNGFGNITVLFRNKRVASVFASP